MFLSETIRLFLDSVGRSEEYEYYLARFRSDRVPLFALLIPDLHTLRSASDSLLFNLRFLMRLELYPALLLSGPCAPEMKEILLKHEDTFQLLDLPEDSGAPSSLDSPAPSSAAPSAGSEFSAPGVASDSAKKEAPFSTGDGAGAMGEALKEIRSRGRIALIYRPYSHPLREAAFLSFRITRRIHFLREAGSLRNGEGEELYYARVPGEALHLQEGDRPLFDLASTLFQGREGIHISVTSPFNLLKEIFTIKGAGTVFRRLGRILRFEGSEGVDLERLSALLARSFGRSLRSGEFFERITHFYIEENYLAAALVATTEFSGSYLSKFAVDTEARGGGLAQDLWDRMCEEHPSLFWRSRSNNSINRWYTRLSTGQHRSDSWTYFWKGIDPEQIADVIRYCQSLPDDFHSIAPESER